MLRTGPLKICMVVHNVYARDARVRRYAEYLAADGQEVDVVSLASEAEELPPKYPNLRVLPIPMARSRKEGLRHALQWANAAMLMSLAVTWRDLRRRYDVVHVHNMPDFLVFCALAPRIRGCPVILDLHDPTPELARSKLGLSSTHPLIRALVALEYVSTRFSSAVITASPSFERVLVERGLPSDRVTVIMNAADEHLFSHASSPSSRFSPHPTFVLLYVGTVAARYGLDVCVRALPLLRGKIPGLMLRIIPKLKGEGVALRELLDLARELGVEEMLEVPDPVPLEQMPGMMRQADLGIYPAVRDCHMDIALSLKIPEMTCVGLPLIATRLPVLEELYGEESIAFFPSRDHSAFAEKVLELYRSPERRDDLARHALERARELTWAGQYALYKDLLSRLVGVSL